jgi:hypothetical protein
MSDFWLWFWRPVAETLGVLALLLGIGLLWLAGCGISLLYRDAKRKVQGWFAK